MTTTGTVILAIVAALPATLTALAALISSVRNGKKVEAVHTAVNSRMTELLELTRKASAAEGVESERNRTATATQESQPS